MTDNLTVLVQWNLPRRVRDRLRFRGAQMGMFSLQSVAVWALEQALIAMDRVDAQAKEKRDAVLAEVREGLRTTP